MSLKSGDKKRAEFYKNMSDDSIVADKERIEALKSSMIKAAAVVGIGTAIYLAYRYDLVGKMGGMS